MPSLTCSGGYTYDDEGVQEACTDYVPDECFMIDGIANPECGNSFGYLTTQGTTQKQSTLNIANFTTTSAAAVGVQNSLRTIEAQIGSYSDCNNWLTGNGAVIDTILGQTTYSTTDLVGVGNFSNPGTNAVAGTVGTNLANGTAALTINLNGAYFNSNAGVGDGVTGINAGSDRAQLFILLHELGHLTGAQGFTDGDSGVGAQTQNNQLLMQHCGDFINSASN